MSLQDRVRHVKESLSIRMVAEKYTALKKCGKGWKGLSPFSQEKTPSFYVDEVYGVFNCFSTGQGGDVLKLISLKEGLSFYDALLKAENWVGIVPISKLDPNSIRKLRIEKSDKRLLSDIAQKAHKRILDKQNEAYQYLTEKRRLSDTDLQTFQLGYVGSAQKSVIDKQKLIRIGWIKEDTGYVYMKDRLIFPIRNVRGEVVAFAGRALNEQQKPKYLNGPNTTYYNKSKILYGLYEGLLAIRENGVIIVEGYIDVIRLHSKGIRNAVAPCGTSLTEHHIREILRYTDEVILMFDGDEAGQRASKKSSELFLKHNVIARVFEIPLGKDPDSLFDSTSE